MDLNEIGPKIFTAVSYLSVIGAGIGIILYFIAGKIGLNIDWIGVLLLLLAWTSAFVISNANISAKKFESLNEKVNQISRDMSAVKDATPATHEKVSQIFNDVSTLKDGTPAQIISIKNQEVFYGLLKEKYLKAKDRIWLTHLDPWAPTSREYDDDARKSYFKEACEFAKTHQDVKIRRIISIPTKDKLDWVEELINETSSLKNLHLAFIKLEDIEDLFTSPVISCQIIDDDEMFLLNPLLNHVPKGDFKNCLYFENKNTVAIYSEYYSKLWDKITDSKSGMGCLLKDGPGTSLFYKHKDMILAHINRLENRQPLEEVVKA